MNIWNILGLDGPTDDLKVIKRAYANKLKTTRPDEDQEAFLILREAYEEAKLGIFYASTEIEHVISPLPAVDSSDSHQKAVLPHVEVRTSMSDSDRLLDRAVALLENKRQRHKREIWEALLDDVHMLSIDEFQDYEQRFREHLLDIFGFYDDDHQKSNITRNGDVIDPETGLLLCKRMGWRNRTYRQPHIFSQIQWLRSELWKTLTARNVARLRERRQYGQSWGHNALATIGLLVTAALIGVLLNYLFHKFWL